MDKVIELAREVGFINDLGCRSTASDELLTKFYTLARADLEAENAKLRLHNNAVKYELSRMVCYFEGAHDPDGSITEMFDAARAALGEK